MASSKSEKSQQEKIPLPEWIVAGIGVALVLLALSFLTYKALFLGTGDPEIHFKITDIASQQSGGLVLAEVSNSGGKTITAFQIIGTSGSEEHTVVIDFLPARSSRKFGMFFSSLPTKDEVTFTPGGYQEP